MPLCKSADFNNSLFLGDVLHNTETALLLSKAKRASQKPKPFRRQTTGAQMVRTIVFTLATALALLEAPGYLGRNKQGTPVVKKHYPVSVSLDVDNRSSRLFFVLPGAYSQTVLGNPPRSYAPFSCLQLQVIDETELFGDAADCD
jgi:hypothetical protein